MFFTSLLTIGGFVVAGAAFPAQSNIQKASCTVPSAGFEALDDAPAINEAILECGNGGTIKLADTYSIRSPIDFSPCRDCDVQLEGTLLISTDWAYWNHKPAFMAFTGVKGAKLRSLTGKGVIDGQGKGFYQRYREPVDTYAFQPILAPILGSSDILVENLLVKNAPQEFFRVDALSKNIKFSKLKVVVEEQWWQWPLTLDSIAFQFRNSSNIDLQSVDVDFKATKESSYVGSCVAIDYSTSNVNIQDITCGKTYLGVTVQIGSFDVLECPPLPATEDTWVKNVTVKNLVANSDFNTGFWMAAGPNLGTYSDITYDNVTIVAPTTNIVNAGSTRYTCKDPNKFQPGRKDINIWFKNYHGNLGPPNVSCNKVDCLRCEAGYVTTCDYNFEGFPK